MATLNVNTRKLGKVSCRCLSPDCVHKGKGVAKQWGKPVPANGPGEWVPEYLTIPDARNPAFTRKRHRRGNPAMA